MELLERIHWMTAVILEILCMTNGQLECRITISGKEYTGNKNVTVSGRRCQVWASQYPHKHTMSEKDFLINTSGNKCRNPDGEPGGPWCYTMDRNKRWEYCGIPFCTLTDDDCYEEDRGNAYFGKINVTESGFPCRPWNSEGAFVYQAFKDQRNYCRSPDDAPFPWCLSSAPGKRWEKCRISVCGTNEITTVTTTTTQKLSQASPSDAEGLTGDDGKKCTSNTVNIEIITVVTLGCVLVALSASVYIIMVLRRNQLQHLTIAGHNQKAPVNVIFLKVCVSGPQSRTMTIIKRIHAMTAAMLGILSMTEGNLECRITPLGKEYTGSKNVTVSGRQCQVWASHYPHKHIFNEREFLIESGNKCRNPDRVPGGPWCYTMDGDTRWEYCDIPLCRLTDDDCYEEGKGNTYLGQINVTESGFPCRPWDSEVAFVYQVFKDQRNYCRSPDDAPFPWCLSSAPGKRWEKCRISVCGTNETTTVSTTTTTRKNSQASRSDTKSSSEYARKCTSNTVNIEIVTVVTLGVVLVALSASVYTIMALRRYQIQHLTLSGQNQKAPGSVNNAYDVGISDTQPIVNSHL